jgi:hypothetical protein
LGFLGTKVESLGSGLGAMSETGSGCQGREWVGYHWQGSKFRVLGMLPGFVKL